MFGWLSKIAARPAVAPQSEDDRRTVPVPLQVSHKLVVFSAAAAAPNIGALFRDFSIESVESFVPTDWLSFVQHHRSDPTLALLVVDGTKGVSPDDLDRLRLIKFLNFENVYVLIEGLDEPGLDDDHFSLVSEELREAAQACALPVVAIVGAPMGLTGQSIPSYFDGVMYSSPRQAMPPVGFRFVTTQSVARDRAWRVDGQVSTGTVSTGDRLISSPSNLRAVVSDVMTEDGSSTMSLEFQTPYFPETGEVLSRIDEAPVLSPVMCVKSFWQGEAIAPGEVLTVQFWFGAVRMKVELWSRISRTSHSDRAAENADRYAGYVEIILRADELLPLDAYAQNQVTGIVTLIARNGVKAQGLVVTDGYADQRRLIAAKPDNLTPVHHVVATNEREGRNGHKGGVLWFTGLSGAGKSTLAVALEKRLFDLGFQVFVLDGDNVRQGLTANLGFSPDDRAENIRRVGEVAALFREAGTIVISSFISPYRSDRDRARHAAFPDFHEIYIEADVKTCIARDPKGLYKKAIKGDIRDFTGISAPYEAPVSPELTINTEQSDVDRCLEQLVNYVERHFRL